MEIIFLLIPLSLVLIGVIVWAFLWSINSGQFEDLEGPAHAILMDDDTPHSSSSDAAKSADADDEHAAQK